MAFENNHGGRAKHFYTLVLLNKQAYWNGIEGKSESSSPSLLLSIDKYGRGRLVLLNKQVYWNEFKGKGERMMRKANGERDTGRKVHEVGNSRREM